MDQERRRYRAYLLRLWWAGHDGQAGWRASLEEPHTGLRHGFATLDQLFAFLKQQADTNSNTENTTRSVSQMGNATMQAELWGARARDWAAIQEGVLVALYEAVLRKTAVGSATALLDVGCGAGMFCELAAKRGARVTGIDATAALIAIARQRVPQGDFRVGEMEELPYTDHAFDVVTGFNSFQYAASPVNALREAGRVAQKGAPIVIAVWGKPEDTEAAAYLAALGSLLPPPPPGAPGPFALSQDGTLEGLVTQAGLTPTELVEVDCLWQYRDEATALRGLLASGPAIRAIQTSGEEPVRDAVAKAIAPFRTVSGGYVLKNKFRYLIATA